MEKRLISKEELDRKLYRSSEFQDSVAKMYPKHLKEESKEEKSKEDNDIETMNLTFVVTEACNLACTYCYECDKNHDAIMTKETAKKAIDTLLDQEKSGHYLGKEIKPFVVIEFIGGEPLLEVELMDYVVQYLRYKAYEMQHPWYKNYMINITTNGVLWETPKVQKFINTHKDKLSVSITIDGDESLHDACRLFPDGKGSHSIVESAVKDAIRRFGINSTKVTLAPENLDRLFNSIKYLWGIGIRGINANVVFEDVWHDEMNPVILYDEMIKVADWIIDNELYTQGFVSLFEDTIGKPMDPQDDQNWCGGNARMLAVGTDGRFFPCIRFMNYSLQNQEEICIGCSGSGIDKPENNCQLNSLCGLTRKSQSTEECFNCEVASGCAWCTAYNYDVFGTPNKRAIFICKMHKARCLANEYYWEKLYKKEGVDAEIRKIKHDDDMKFILKNAKNGGKKNE